MISGWLRQGICKGSAEVTTNCMKRMKPRRRAASANPNQTEEILTMKKIFVAIAIFAVPAVFACPVLHAQEVSTTQVSTTTGATRTAVTDAEIELLRKDIRSQRKQIIAANV